VLRSPFSEVRGTVTEVAPSPFRRRTRPVSEFAADAATLAVENTKLREELETLRRVAMHDSLTGLHNRRYFEQRIASELARYERFGDDVSVLLIDVDDFKRVNDRWGHAKGDEVLVWVAAFLTSQLRTLDVVCRLGGDEFAVILPATSEAGALICAERLRQVLTETSKGARHRVRFSIGTGSTRPNRHTRENLLADADASMYRHKRRGRSLSNGL